MAGRNVRWALVRGSAGTSDGFTLVELLVALAVLAILLNIAAPSFRDTVAELRQSARYNRLASDLHLARSEAIQRSRPVRLCANGDAAAGGGQSACGTDLARGWHLFVEGGGGTTGTIDADETVLRTRRFDAEEGVSVTARAIVRPAPIATLTSIAFDSRGRADWRLGTVVLCDRRGADEALALIVNGAGNFRRAEPASASSTVPVDAFDDAVTC